jgi:8-hydroxy-5-deazaflavin:NADPH oxidoreductase
MRVGLLGSGDVGRALAVAFAEQGHSVTIGTSSPDKAELVAWRGAVGRGVEFASFAQTAERAELAVLCCRGDVAEKVLDLAGPDHLAGKVLIDTTNPLDLSKGFPPGIFVGLTDSLGERVQRKAPKARVVKCFNIVANSLMGHPDRHGSQPDMMIAGNDPSAKAEVVGVLRSFGWSGAIDLGGIESARWLEALVPLWVRVGQAIGTFDFGFKVVR